MMDPHFQDCVSEFDLELFYQGTTANPAPLPPPLCPGAKSRGCARLKGAIKNTHIVVQKACSTNEILEKTKKALLKTNTEYQNTKILLDQQIETNERFRNNITIDSSEKLKYTNEIQTLTERLKALEEIEGKFEQSERVVLTYSDQMKGLATEMENEQRAKKQAEKERSRVNKELHNTEKKIVTLLSKYILPMYDKPDRWIHTLMKKYMPNKNTDSIIRNAPEHTSNEVINNVVMSTLISEHREEHGKIIEDEESPINTSMLNRNNSLDFEFIGSVDTGRGSSLAFSDGEKGFRSPDYYMNESPMSTIPNECNNCSIPKSDVATSPIHETFDIVQSNIYSSSMRKIDACTSPIPLERLDVATDTSDMLNDRCTLKSTANKCTSPVKLLQNMISNDQKLSTRSCINTIEEPANAIDNEETELNCINISNIKSPTVLVHLPDNTTSNTDVSVNNNNGMAGQVENVTTIQPVLYEKAETNKFDISIQETAAKLPDDVQKQVLNNDNRIACTVEELTTIQEGNNKQIATNIIHIFNEESSTAPVMRPIPDNMASNTDEILNDGYEIAGKDEDLATLPAASCDEAINNDVNISSKELSKPPVNVHNIILNRKQNIRRSTLHEKEYRNLSNSNNYNNDIAIDAEVQSIFDKMELREQFITPIPPTPPGNRMQSPSLISNDLNQRSSQITEEDKIEEQNEDPAIMEWKTYTKYNRKILAWVEDKLYRKQYKVLKEISSFDEDSHTQVNKPEAIMQLMTQTSAVTTVSELNTMIINNSTANNIEGSARDYNDVASAAVMPEQGWVSEDLHHITIKESNNNEKQGMCNIDDKLPIATAKNIITVPKKKITESDSAVSHITQEDSQHIHTQNNVLDLSNNTDGNVVNLNSTLSTSNDIVYEASTSDEDIHILRRDSTNIESEDVDHIMSTDTSCKKITPIKEISKVKTKKNKLTMLQKRRLQLMPKSKIREEVLQPAKKNIFKPSPIIAIPKKRVTECDTAATLNDKSVYENAVKIMAASKSNLIPPEPRVIVEDYRFKMHVDLQSGSRNDINKKHSDNSLKTQLITKTTSEINNEKMNSLFGFENITSTTKNRKDAKEQPIQIFGDKSEPKACKRKCTSDPKEPAIKRKRGSDICDQRKLGEIEEDNNVGKSESVACQRLLRSSKSFDESDDETLSTIRSNKSSLYNATKNTKRLRNSNLDGQIPLKQPSNSNKDIQLPYTNHHERTDNKEDSISASHNDNSEQVAKRNVAKDRATVNRLDSDDTLSDNAITEMRDQIIHEVNKGPVSPSQRILRSSNTQHKKENGFTTESNFALTSTECNPERHAITITDPVLKSQHDDNTALTSHSKTSRKSHNSSSVQKSFEINNIELCNSSPQNNNETIISYADLSLFINEESNTMTQEQSEKVEQPAFNKHNILCRMIEKYGVHRIKGYKKVPDAKATEMCNKLETSLMHIAALPTNQCLGSMKKLVTEIRSWNPKHFIVGLLKFLKDPQRKMELFSKVQSQQQAPPMTKNEQVLLYVIDELENSLDYKGIVNKILMNIEYILFALNKSPEFEVVESLSHFYALLCRYHQKISKLRLFIVDAMYCLQFKSITLIKICLDVWMFILPMGHMGLAKTSLVTCLVYLLHFFKCDDKSQQAFEMRIILKSKYNYDLTDWNEPKILEVFRTAITELQDNPMERKMLRLAVIILAKRYGPKWCNNFIVKKMLKPIIEEESTPDVAKRFSVSILGALLKPYPNDMKVHCEIMTDYLLEMLNQTRSQNMQEAILTSLLCLNRYHTRVIQFLLKWNPKKVSPEFYTVFKDYVKSKPVKTWKSKLSQIL